MKFVDQVRIEVKAGDGGDGAVAFRREKYIEKGGPSGGDGGRGGSVIFVADPQLTTLLDYRYQQHHHAPSGQHGMGSDCNGRNGDDLELRVPVGTLVKRTADDGGALLCDLSEPGQRFVAAKGGRGGLGNMNFTTSTRQAPRFAQDGKPGECFMLVLELKLLADVGLLGFPNAGKSTFISRISRARPKVADYPFTTLVPNLGVVAYKDGLSFVVADIPGLIEGASDGQGLGHRFLRHVERCRVLVHLVDLSAADEGRSPTQDFDVINRELMRFSPALADMPQVVVANKLDVTEAREALPAFEAAMRPRGVEVLPMSGATGEGAQAVLDACAELLFASRPGRVAVTARQALAKQPRASSARPRATGGKRPAAKKKPAVKRPPVKTAKKASPVKRAAVKGTAEKRRAGPGAAKR